VRASDRWHVPADERAGAVTQRLLDGTPVVETGVRVPGGQVLHRAWCAVAAGTGDEWAVVEIDNRSREPVGVALVVVGGRRVSYDDRLVRVDGRAALVLPRAPSRFTTAAADGGRESWAPGANAFVFPLAHTARLRVAMPLAADRQAPPVDVAALPDAERVAGGWQSHVQAQGTVRVVLPDGDPLAADRAALLVAHDDPRLRIDEAAAALDALDRCAHHATVAAALPGLVLDLRARRWGGAGRLLVTAAGHHRRTATVLDVDLVAPVAEAAHKLRRRGRGDPWTVPGQLAAAELLDGAGQPEAAERCRRLAAAMPPAGRPAVDPDGGPAGRVASMLDALLVDGPGGVALAPGYADEWLGQGVEVHDAPTRFGRVSFAVRWHGARPALLWQAGTAVPLTCPRLDPSWSTDEPRGEALLAPVGLPGVVQPLAGQQTPAAGADEGGTFA
jgi:hypothetical protein